MKRVISLLLTALLVAALFAGCADIGLKPIEQPPAEPAKTEPAKTEAPKTEPPATEPAKTEPARTEAPETEPPATEAPETEPPATEAPATEPPKTEPPKPVNDGDVSGYYKLKGINGMTLEEYFKAQFAEAFGSEVDLDFEAIMALAGVSLDSLEEMITFTLNPDGSVLAVMSQDEETEQMEGTWELKDGQVWITFDDEPVAFDYVDGQLIADMDGERMIFGR